jgi:hypothetical protein
VPPPFQRTAGIPSPAGQAYKGEEISIARQLLAAALDQIWQGLDPHKHPLIFGQGNQQNQPPALNLPPAFNLGVP